MGASSGTGGHLTAHDAAVLREEAQKRLTRGKIDAEVNSLLQHELTSINDRDVETIDNHLRVIEEVLGDRLAEVDRLLFGGSVAKHTYVNGLSDVDALVLLGNTAAGTNPSDAIDAIARALRRALPMAEVSSIREGTMAVTVEYRDGSEIQLLPAIGTGDDVEVGSWDRDHWVKINPRRFARELTLVNQKQGNAVVPAIKLAKAIFANRLGRGAPSGYHVEALAVAAFQDYMGPRTPKAMVSHLVDYSSWKVLSPIQDPTGQSANVDDALGARNSSARRELSQRFTDIARTMTRAQSVDQWRALLD